jgi:hypothetical protein
MTTQLDNEIRTAIQKISLILIKKDNRLLRSIRNGLYKDILRKTQMESLSIIQWRLYDTTKIKS